MATTTQTNAPPAKWAGLLWDNVAGRVTAELKGGRCRVEAAVLSPAKEHLATCAEARRSARNPSMFPRCVLR